MRRTYPINHERKGCVMTDTPFPQKIKTVGDMARDHTTGENVEPHVARMGEPRGPSKPPFRSVSSAFKSSQTGRMNDASHHRLQC